MVKTVVDFILPMAFIDEGKYSVKIEKDITTVMITLLPNKEVMERISDIVSFGKPKMIPDPHGVVNMTKVTIEFPYLIEPYNSIKQECIKYLNRLIEVVRYQTRIYWIPSISDRDIFKYSFEAMNENGKVDLFGQHETSEFMTRMRNEGEKYLNKVKLIADEKNIQIKTEMISSINIAGGIVDYAEENNIDLIVIGTRGRSGFKKLLLGSVASHVITYAHCPVLVVK